MEVLVLKQEIMDRLKRAPLLKGQLADANTCSIETIDRWRYEKNQMLTTATNLSIMRSFFKLPEDYDLTEPVQPPEPAPA